MIIDTSVQTVCKALFNASRLKIANVSSKCSYLAIYVLLLSPFCAYAAVTCDASDTLTTFSFTGSGANSWSAGNLSNTAGSSISQTFSAGTGAGAVSFTITASHPVAGSNGAAIGTATTPIGNVANPLLFDMTQNAGGDKIKIDFAFNKSINKLQYQVLDVDYGSFQDTLPFTDAPVITAVTPSYYTISSNPILVATRSGDPNCGTTSSACNLTVDYPNPVSGFTMDFQAGPDFPTPTRQYVGIQALAFCVPSASPNLRLAKSAASMPQGGSGTYTFTANNYGGAATSATITVKDILPAGMSFGFASPYTPGGVNGADWNCNVSTTANANDTVICTSAASLAAGALSSFELPVAVAANASGTLNNKAKIYGGGDPNKSTETSTGAGGVGACTAADENVAGNVANAGCAFEAATIATADFGDAPAGYDSTPAQHTSLGAQLGAVRDNEINRGNGFVGAFDGTQDDASNTGSADDEDALSTIPTLPTGVSTTYTLSNLFVGNIGAAGARLCGWIDFGNGGTFSNQTNSAANRSNERVCATVNSGSTTASLTWNIPSLSAGIITYLRLRIVDIGSTCAGLGNITNATVLNAGDVCGTGEVEDYRIIQGFSDFGDAPDSYDNVGEAVHYATGAQIAPTSGNTRDTESSKNTSANALGDDQNGVTPDDEDVFVSAADVDTSLATYSISATAINLRGISNPGGTANDGAKLCAWVDFNLNGKFDTVTEQTCGTTTSTGNNRPISLSALAIPNDAVPGTSYLRLRVVNNPNTALTPAGAFASGEVEDHTVTIRGDYGDAPAAYDAGSAARHSARGSVLGSARDVEANNAASAAADGDDNADTDDDDAYTIFPDFYLGQTDTLTIPVSGIPASGAKLCGWIDYDASSSFDTSERVCTAVASGATTADLTWTIPVSATLGATYARLRIVDNSAIADFDAAAPQTSGEVEDYALNITSGPPTLAAIGDVSVNSVSIDALISQLGGNADLLKLLSLWDPQLAEALQGANIAVIVDALRQFLDPDGDGIVALMRWNTLMERGTVGFFAEREDPVSGEWLRLNNGNILPGLITATQGGEYLLVDPAVKSGETQRYRLVEHEVWGAERTHGPWKLLVGSLNAVKPSSQQSTKNDTVKKNPVGLWKVMGQGYMARVRHVFEPAQAVTAALQQQHTQSRVVGSGAGASGVRLRTGSAGLYRLSAAELVTVAASLGISADNLNQQLSAGLMRLDSAGALVPYNFDTSNGSLYFTANDYRTLETQENVFRLRPGAGVKMSVVTGAGPVAVPSGIFRERQKFEENNWLLTWVHNEESADYWYWDYIYAPDRPSVSLKIQLPEPTVQGQGKISIYLRGASDEARGKDHQASLRLNGVPLPGSVTWNGNAQAVLQVGFNQALLDAPVNGLATMNLQIDGKVLAGETYSLFMIDRVEVDYSRKMHAHEGSVWLRSVAAGVHAVGGFVSKAVKVIENPGTVRAKWRKNVTISADAQGEWQVSFNAPVKADYLLVETPNNLSIEEDASSALKTAAHSADYLIIAPRELAQSAAALAAYRAHEFGAEIAWLEDIYDEFSFGRTQSEAIEKFLVYTHKHWKHVPRYVVLLGRGTLDHRDLLGYHESLMPMRLAKTPWGLMPSDNRYADIDGDKLPDFLLGRIAASSEAEALAYISKLIAYEAALPDGIWNVRAVLVADNPDDAGNFRVNSSRISKLLQSYAQGYVVSNLFYPLADVRGNLLNDWRTNGYGYVNYIGHGAATQLAAEGFMTVDDVDNFLSPFNNTPRLPIFAALTCAVGDSSEPGVLALSDKLILHETGGAIAAFSPTGLSLDEQAFSLNKHFVDSLLGDRATIGESVEFAYDSAAKTGSIAPFMHDIYQISGDPAVKLR